MSKLLTLYAAILSTWLIGDVWNFTANRLHQTFNSKNKPIVLDKGRLAELIDWHNSSLYETFGIFPIYSENLNKESWLSISYDWTKYDFSEFDRKVLQATELIMRENLDPDFDRIFLFKIWIIENMWGGKKEIELPVVFEKFAWDYILHTSNKRSNKQAYWTFQVLPSTLNALEKKYGVLSFLDWMKEQLTDEFGIKTDEDMKVLLNALYAAVCLYEAEQIAGNMWYKDIDEKSLAWIYNMWPRYLKTKNLNSETRWYIQKLTVIDDLTITL